MNLTKNIILKHALLPITELSQQSELITVVNVWNMKMQLQRLFWKITFNKRLQLNISIQFYKLNSYWGTRITITLLFVCIKLNLIYDK